MKAVVLHGKNDICYEEWPEPILKPGTVKIHVKACGICGSDIPRVLGDSAHYYPIILGHEFSGCVTEVADDVDKIQVGDHVAGVPLLPCMQCDDCQQGNYSQCKHYSFIGSREQGGYADYVVLPERNAVKVEPSLPYEQAALFEPCTVALHGLKINEYQGGKTVAVLGNGTIGMFTQQWAKLFGSRLLAVLGRNKERFEISKRLGADYTINTLDENYMEQAMEITNGRGFDYVFETAGSTFTLKLAFEIAANHANICFIGTPTQDLSFTPKQWENMNRKEFRVTGSWMSGCAPFPGDEWTMTADFFARGDLKYDPAMIYKRFSLRDADKAFHEFEQRDKVKGRIMLVNAEG